MYFSVATIMKMALFVSAVNAVALPATTSADSQPTATPEVPPPNADIPESTVTDLTGVIGADGNFTIMPAPDAQTDAALQKRIAPIVAIGAGIVATTVAEKVVQVAYESAAGFIKNMGNWNQARESFTRQTTKEMWARNPDYSKYPAAICYNKGYGLRNPNGKTGLRSAKLSLGVLNTDYDCMYMTGNNAFYTHAEGGYVNLAYTYNKRCKFDQRTGDLTCA